MDEEGRPPADWGSLFITAVVIVVFAVGLVDTVKWVADLLK
jgi:hypothetical protein